MGEYRNVTEIIRFSHWGYQQELTKLSIQHQTFGEMFELAYLFTR